MISPNVTTPLGTALNPQPPRMFLDFRSGRRSASEKSRRRRQRYPFSRCPDRSRVLMKVRRNQSETTAPRRIRERTFQDCAHQPRSHLEEQWSYWCCRIADGARADDDGDRHNNTHHLAAATAAVVAAAVVAAAGAAQPTEANLRKIEATRCRYRSVDIYLAAGPNEGIQTKLRAYSFGKRFIRGELFSLRT